MLLARLFESLTLVCPNCGADMRSVAFVTEAAPVQRILAPIGEPTEPPPIAPARGPPGWDDHLADAQLGPHRPTGPSFSLHLIAAVALPQETVQPLSSLGRSLPRRCSPQQPRTRVLAPLATCASRPSAPPLRVDCVSRPR